MTDSGPESAVADGFAVGRLGAIDREAVAAAVGRGQFDKIYDLAVTLHEGIPTWRSGGDPPFLQWMTTTPAGGRVDDPSDPLITAGRGFAADCFLAPTHSGTHIDCLNHALVNGRAWRGIEAERALGSRFWHEAGAEHLPPIVLRGVLLDLATSDALDSAVEIGPTQLLMALERQHVTICRDDVVLLRTGWMRNWPSDRYLGPQPGLTRAGAEFLVDQGAALIGADNAALEVIPEQPTRDSFAVHAYLLIDQGVQIIENLQLDELANDMVHTFVFIALPLKIRGATGSPVRPIAVPLTRAASAGR